MLLDAIQLREHAHDMTCISCGLEIGTAMLRDSKRDGALPGILLLLTDGRQTAGGTDASAIYRSVTHTHAKPPPCAIHRRASRPRLRLLTVLGFFALRLCASPRPQRNPNQG